MTGKVCIHLVQMQYFPKYFYLKLAEASDMGLRDKDNQLYMVEKKKQKQKSLPKF